MRVRQRWSEGTNGTRGTRLHDRCEARIQQSQPCGRRGLTVLRLRQTDLARRRAKAFHEPSEAVNAQGLVRIAIVVREYELTGWRVPGERASLDRPGSSEAVVHRCPDTELGDDGRRRVVRSATVRFRIIHVAWIQLTRQAGPGWTCAVPCLLFASARLVPLTVDSRRRAPLEMRTFRKFDAYTTAYEALDVLLR